MSKAKRKENKSKLPITTFSKSATKLPITKAEVNNTIFSFEKFKCVSIKNKDFNNQFKNLWAYGEWSLKLIRRLSEISTMKALDLKNRGKSLRCHPVQGKNLDKLKSVLESIGLSSSEQLEDCDYYELSLGASDGRIFGYFIRNIYYVLLFDPNHLIYKQVEYGAQLDLLYKNFDPWKEI